MAVKLKFKIGGIVVEVTGAHEEDAWKEASFWNELPCECGNCQSPKIALRYRQAADYEFYELLCRECGYTYACGQKKEGGLYPRGNKDTGDWDPPYEGNGGGREERTERRSDDRGRGNDRGGGGRQQDPPRGRQETQPATRDQGRGRGNDSGERGRQSQPAQQNRATAPAGDLDDDDIPF